jgi:hypothetical protein
MKFYSITSSARALVVDPVSAETTVAEEEAIAAILLLELGYLRRDVAAINHCLQKRDVRSAAAAQTTGRPQSDWRARLGTEGAARVTPKVSQLDRASRGG